MSYSLILNGKNYVKSLKFKMQHLIKFFYSPIKFKFAQLNLT
jgi:hypothetical protein